MYSIPNWHCSAMDVHHLSCRYAVVVRTELCSEPVDDHRQLVFDENGETVYEKSLNVYNSRGRPSHKKTVEIEELKIKFSIGERVFDWQR